MVNEIVNEKVNKIANKMANQTANQRLNQRVVEISNGGLNLRLNQSVNVGVKDRDNIEIVNFLDIDTSKITFRKPKPNKHNGTQIGILYNGKTLYVKYEGYTPFGLKENYDKDGSYLCTGMQINCDGKYLEKAKELDQFFINYMHSIEKEIPREDVAGYDEHGQGGSWKRICKKPYNIIDNERVYLDHPSRMDFTLLFRNDRIATRFFTWKGKKLGYESVKIWPQSKVKFIAAWFHITTGTFGSAIKPKLMQVTYREEEEENIFNNFILDDEEDLNPDDFMSNMSNMSWTMPTS